ncbi:Fpg/Nei family DNA glycosylase [Nocardioides litoris]|uniref:Fpg/Nei family DNA glycosylase n=1 Tax=Nocardioides litoris TaxID=1926648 RepID=UPI0011240E90|nr:DNA-formamidopyrimidine glycosylase family protein [Nocardioides litoris]
MPEGHTIHRLARRHRRMLKGKVVHTSSPQGRFAEGAAQLDGRTVLGTDAWGKHLFHRFDDGWLHVHLGLFGRYRDGAGEPPEPKGALRLRMTTEDHWIDLRGPTACELLADPERDALLARLGPDPLRPGTPASAAAQRIGRSRSPIGTLLMNQAVVAGIGNVYRAEILFRHGLHPWTPGREVDEATWTVLWDDLVVLMESGVRTGRIVTTEPEDRERPGGRVRRVDASYVYHRTGRPCRRCGTPVESAELAARTVYWCPVCQPET